MSIGDSIYGTSAGLGDVDVGAIDTTGLIDPFYFSAVNVAEPASWSLILTGVAAVAWLRRRRAVPRAVARNARAAGRSGFAPVGDSGCGAATDEKF